MYEVGRSIIQAAFYRLARQWAKSQQDYKHGHKTSNHMITYTPYYNIDNI